MAQLTIRADDELVERVRVAARVHGRSMNDYITRLLDAATNPDLAGDEAAVLRERLAQVGLLATPGTPRHRPSPARVAAARAAAGRGTPLSDVVSRDRT